MGQPVFKELKRAYGFDEVSIVPGQVTINPEQADMSLHIGEFTFLAPVLGAAMDATGSPQFVASLNRLGLLGVMNMEGIQARYENPEDALQEIIQAPQGKITPVLQKIYSAPINEHLIGERVQEVKSQGATCAVSFTPANTKKLAPIAVEAGLDILVVQSTVTTARHLSKSPVGLRFQDLVKQIKVPVIVGNCVGYGTALELMETGISGLLIGVGPGATCTTREVVGIGVPQVTATLDCAAARAEYYRRTGKYVPVITDGGIRTGGDLCKAIACGADGVMLGTPLSQAEEAPGQGYNWGMASPHPALPRGTRIRVGVKGTLKEILFGPSSLSDGTQNLLGSLQLAMGVCGAFTIKDMHMAEVIIAPAIKTEGKLFQMLQEG